VPALDFWVVQSPEDLRRTAARAAEAERLGFTGVAYGDSQSRSGDTVVAMTVAALSTSTIGIGTGVTNCYTRHPAVMAGAFASLQNVSNGRMLCGIGRGDSALAFLGVAPAPLDYFARYLRALQGYLSGGEVPFEDLPTAGLSDAAVLPLEERPAFSSLRWVDGSVPKVPVDVAASGPKVIRLAALIADRLTFAVGAEPTRVAWAIDLARQARADAGLDPDGIRYGAFITVAVDDDPGEARRLGGGILTAVSRLSVMHGTIQGPVDEMARQTFTALRERYHMSGHAESGSAHGQLASAEFADAYGLYGPPEHFVERLNELVELGITHVRLVPPLKTSDPDGVTMRRLGEEVIPSFERVGFAA
jgi:5,10-methylenetetrahydromethanopterin reductase